MGHFSNRSPRPKKAKVTKSLGKNMYSPDLAPMNSAVFPYIKSFLRGMRFDNLSELRQAVMNVIFQMKTDQFVQIFYGWVRRHKKCVEIKVITKLPNSKQSYKGKVKTHNYINRQNQSTTGKL